MEVEFLENFKPTPNCINSAVLVGILVMQSDQGSAASNARNELSLHLGCIHHSQIHVPPDAGVRVRSVGRNQFVI
jgi:hypothetical protein